MRDPTVKIAEEKRVKDAAVEEAVRRLRPLLDARLYPGKARSWPIVNWADPTNHPEDEFYAAIELVDAVLSQLDADSPVGTFARIAHEHAIPALRRGRPPTRKKDSSRPQKKNSSPRNVLRDRWIAAVVDQICSRYKEFKPTRNETTKGKRECGCSIVAMALAELKIPLAEDYIEAIWKQNRSQT
jgi:hypothetical protein